MTNPALTPREAAREALTALREGETRLSELSPEARALYETLAEDELKKMARGDISALSKGTRGAMAMPRPKRTPGQP